MGMVISCSKDNIRKWLDLFPVLSIVVPSKMTYDMNGISVKQINKELRSNQQYIWERHNTTICLYIRTPLSRIQGLSLPIHVQGGNIGSLQHS